MRERLWGENSPKGRSPSRFIPLHRKVGKTGTTNISVVREEPAGGEGNGKGQATRARMGGEKIEKNAVLQKSYLRKEEGEAAVEKLKGRKNDKRRAHAAKK